MSNKTSEGSALTHLPSPHLQAPAKSLKSSDTEERGLFGESVKEDSIKQEENIDQENSEVEEEERPIPRDWAEQVEEESQEKKEDSVEKEESRPTAVVKASEEPVEQRFKEGVTYGPLKPVRPMSACQARRSFSRRETI